MRMLTWNLAGKRVFLRADLNTNLEMPLFTQSLKFQRLLPTLHYLKKHGAHITVATHIGRPLNYDPHLSTQQLVNSFIAAGFSCVFRTPDNLAEVLNNNYDSILLENLRFYPQEEHQSVLFAQKIARGCDFFVEDGFGVLTRNETSITTTAQLFSLEKRSIGLLVQGELEHLRFFKEYAKKPYLVMVGGGKGLEKLAMLYNFFDKATHIALCPGLSELPEAKSFMYDAEKAGVTLLVPTDYTMHQGIKIAIGPKTFELWQPIITRMQTILYNGMMGMHEYPETTYYTQQLFKLFMETNADVVLAGGDTTLSAQQWNIMGKKIYLSTGGGSTLAYVSGQELPGLRVIER